MLFEHLDYALTRLVKDLRHVLLVRERIISIQTFFDVQRVSAHLHSELVALWVNASTIERVVVSVLAVAPLVVNPQETCCIPVDLCAVK